MKSIIQKKTTTQIKSIKHNKKKKLKTLLPLKAPNASKSKKLQILSLKYKMCQVIIQSHRTLYFDYLCITDELKPVVKNTANY